MNPDYLVWTRKVADKLASSGECYSLIGSSIQEPTQILMDTLGRIYSDGTLTKNMADKGGWGHGAVLKALSSQYKIPDAEKRTLLTTGASAAYHVTCRALLQAGDHVLVELPTYQPFLAVLDTIGVEINFIRREAPEFSIDFDQVESAISPKTRLIVLSNLHNPTAAWLDDEMLQNLSNLASKHRLHILVDEVFHDFVLGSQQPAALFNETLISISSLSKVYGLSSLRCGWIIAAPDVIQQIRPMQSLLGTGRSRLTHSIAATVFAELDAYSFHWQNLMQDNRKIIRDYMMPLIQDGMIQAEVSDIGCVYFPLLNSVNDVEAFTKWLWHIYQVQVVPGHFFGEANHIRIGYGGNTARLQAGLERLVEGIRLFSGSR